jgi:DHA1 family multidrug resistance protein-like MFS transporter
MARPLTAHTPILVWMCVLIAINQLGFGSIVPALALYASSFGVSQAAIGMAIAVYGLARFLVALPAGQLADRAGRRKALALGGLLSAIGNLLCAYAPTFPALIGARFVAGAGAALVLTTGTIVLADITSPAQRGRAMAIYQGVFLFAVGVGPLPGGLIAERYGLAAPFLVYAASGVIAAAIAWIHVPETKGLRHGYDETFDPRALVPSFAAQIRLLSGHVGFMLVGLISFTNAVARTGGLFNVIPIVARDRLALNADRIGIGLALASLVGLALAYPAGVMADRYGRKIVIAPSTVMAGLSITLFAVAPSYGWFLVACVVWSIASGISGAAPATYAADVAPPGMNAAAMSTYRMLGDFGYVVGPIALGLTTDLVGSDATLVGVALLLVVVAALFARFAPETYRVARF